MLTQGSNREAYEDMINEHIARFHREVVSEVEAFAREHPRIRVVIGGEEHAAHALRNLMPDHFDGALVGVLKLPMRLSSTEILQNVLPAATEFERRQEMKLVTDVIDLAKSGGRGALGREAVQQALEMQQVELLILPYPLDNEETATEASARAFESGGSVELVHGNAADRLKEEGGVAALLYYAL
jgi:stalled ribosome rescue protein Dom34